MKEFLKHIKLGDYVESLIHVLTLGYGNRISHWYAVDILGLKSCGCCSRKQWLNRLTNPEYDGKCNEVRLF
jgi:hypothetical protein